MKSDVRRQEPEEWPDQLKPVLLFPILNADF